MMEAKNGLMFAPMAILALGAFPEGASGQQSGQQRGIRSCTSISDPGFYQLQRNIQADDANVCLNVTVDHVVIDLGGFVIRGVGGFYGGAAVGGTAARGVTIRNGTIADFGVGVDLANVENASLSEMTFVSNNSVGADLGPGASVRSSFFTKTADDNWALRVGRGSIIKDSIFSGNAIAASVGPGSVVINNIAKDNGFDSMNIGGTSVVAGNVILDTSDEGMHVGPLSVIVNNAASGSEPDLLIDCPSNLLGNAANALSTLTTDGACTLNDNLFLFPLD